MIDEKDLQSTNDDDGFADEREDALAFRLESLEQYPDSTPFELADSVTDESSDSVKLPASTIAAVKSDLESSRRKKSKPDTLELSLDRLRKVLSSTSEEVAEYTIQNDLLSLDLSGSGASLSSEDLAISDKPSLSTRPKKVKDPDAPIWDEEASPSSKTKAAATSSSKKKKRRPGFAFPFVPIIGGVAGITILVGAYFFFASRSSRNAQKVSDSKAQNSQPTPTQQVNKSSDYLAAQQSSDAKTKETVPSAVTQPSTQSSPQRTDAITTEVPAARPAESQIAQRAIPSSPSTDTKGKNVAGGALTTPSTSGKNSTQSTSASTVSSKLSASDRPKLGVKPEQRVDPKNVSASARAEGTVTPTGASTKQTKFASDQSKFTPDQSKISSEQQKKTSRNGLVQQEKITKSTEKKTSSITQQLPGSGGVSNASSPSKKVSNSTEAGQLNTSSKSKNSVPGKPDNEQVSTNGKRVQSTGSAQSSTIAYTSKKLNEKSITVKEPYVQSTFTSVGQVTLRTSASSNPRYSVHVLSTGFRVDADRWLEKLQQRHIQEGYVSEQQVRDKIVYNVRFGSYRTKVEAETALQKTGLPFGSVFRIQ